MICDKLPAFKQYLLQSNASAAALITVKHSAVLSTFHESFDIETHMGLKTSDPEQNEFLGNVMIQLDKIKAEMAEMRTVISNIYTLKREAIQATSPEQEKSISKKLNGLLSISNHAFLNIKRKLEELRLENQRFIEREGNTSEAKMRENLHAVVTHKFREMLKEYQSLQTEFKRDVCEKVTRQVKIVFPEASDYEIEKIVENGDMSAGSAIRMQMVGQTHESLTNTLSDIQAKYKDIQHLEKSVEDLHQMFVDLAVLVEAQGELFDQIDYSVKTAKDYTEKAEKELVHSRKHQIKVQRKMLCISICVIALFCIIALPTLLILLH